MTDNSGESGMTKRPSLFFVGGFLGAGKTTAINSLAFMLAQQEKRVAVITNDQAEGLVDTYFLAGCGLPAEEVSGSCFCCNFPGLVEAIKHSVETVNPDVILAEPVGSCTDIVATVVRPMRVLMGDTVDVKAFSVLVEPDRWAELRDSSPNPSWSMKFLFDKQLEEADFIVITKLDTVTQKQFVEMRDQARREFPEAQVMGISAKKDLNVDRWLELVQSSSPGEQWLKEIDYEKYAEAEAEMGWLNAQVSFAFSEPTDGRAFAKKMIVKLMQGIDDNRGGIGHLKLLGASTTGRVKAGVTTASGKVELDGDFIGPVPDMEMTINVRATVSPGDLSAIVNDSVKYLQETSKAQVEITYLNTFRPGAPNPTHRYDS